MTTPRSFAFSVIQFQLYSIVYADISDRGPATVDAALVHTYAIVWPSIYRTIKRAAFLPMFSKSLLGLDSSFLDAFGAPFQHADMLNITSNYTPGIDRGHLFGIASVQVDTLFFPWDRSSHGDGTGCQQVKDSVERLHVAKLMSTMSEKSFGPAYYSENRLLSNLKAAID